MATVEARGRESFKTILLVLLLVLASISLSGRAIATAMTKAAILGTEADQRRALPVIDWSREVSLPDDLLYVPHESGRPQARLIFLISLDAKGAVTSVRAISGFSLYLQRSVEQINRASFSPDLAGKTFVLRIHDPLQKLFDNWKLYRTDGCTSSTDLTTLYRVGALQIGRGNEGIDTASHCYKYILDRNPSSVAARYGWHGFA